MESEWHTANTSGAFKSNTGENGLNGYRRYSTTLNTGWKEVEQINFDASRTWTGVSGYNKKILQIYKSVIESS